jgi:hypothetical protein
MAPARTAGPEWIVVAILIAIALIVFELAHSGPPP